MKEQLEKCRIDLSNNKGQQQLLKKQLEEEDKMRNFLHQQIKGNDEQLATLTKDLEMAKEWKKRVEVAEKIAKGIQNELGI